MSAIRVGYKQTELGVIPEDWICTSVGKLVQSDILEKPLDGNHGNIHPKSGDFVDFGIPFVMANNVQGGRLDLHNCSFIRKEQADSLQKGFSRSGDVLLTHKATIGNTAIVGEIPFPYVMLTPQVTYYRVKDRERLSNVYLRHFFDSASFQKTLQLMSGGGTRSYIGITAQLQLPVVVPPTVAEQEAVAEALSDADALIESLEQLLAKKRNLKQGTIQELLTGKKRLPGFSGEWHLKCLKDMVQTPITDGPHLTPKFLDSGVPFLSVNNLANNRIDLTDLRFISREDDCVFSRKCKPQRNDILIGKAASVGKVALVDFDFDFNIWSPIALIRVGNGYDPRFVYYQLLGPEVASQITLLTNSSSQGNIGMGDIEKLHLRVPEFDEQCAIASILTDMDAEIAELEVQLAKTHALKQGMMQKLLTGEIRLI